jgi:hypothetical protein
MAKTKAQLRTENSNNFPNNNTQFITPEKLRGFNNDIIDAVALENNTILSGTGSFSNLSGSGYVSASEFIGDGSKLSGVTATVPAGTVSGSSQIILQDTTGDLSGSRIDGQVASALSSSYAVTASFALNVVQQDTGSLLTTASVSDANITFTKGDASQFSIEVNNVSASIQAEDLVITVKNVSGVTLPAGTAVKATGVTGENITIVSASADTPSLMPAIGVLNEQLTNNSTGECYIAGRLENIDTSNLVAGAAVYVDINGGLTATKPTGSSLIQNIGIAAKINATEGELVIQGSGRSNDVPNITEGYIWVGDSDDVAQEFSTGSIAFTNKNNIFTGNQTFNDITVNGTGSFAYIESVTGSAKIIGDAFLILNNDTPTERYAGIKVIDSGSTQGTASLQFDGQTNDWFYEYTASGDPLNHGVVLFGPEYGTLGSPTYLTNNTIPKGDGGHHLNDSNITDTGTLITLNSNTDVQGNITTTGTVDGIDIQSLNSEVQVVSSSVHQINQDTGSFATLGANTFTGNQILDGQDIAIRIGTSGDPSQYPNFDMFASEGTFPANIYASNMINNDNKETGFEVSTYTGQSGSNAVSRMALNNQTVMRELGGTISYPTPQLFTNTLDLRGAVSSSTFISASAFIGDGSQLSGVDAGIFTQTGSFFSTNNDVAITGSLNVKGGIGTENVALTITSNTASIDMRESNYYELTLVSSADTHLDVDVLGNSNGQSINILVKQPFSGNTGSISFSNDFKFAGGYSYQPTPANDTYDILSFTRYGNSLYGTFLNNFS